MKLLSFGEILFDVFPEGEYIGGAPLNLASHSAIQGADAYIMSAVGRDTLGLSAINEVKKLGVKTEYISSVDGISTGKCIVTLDEKAVPSYNLLTNVAYDYIPFPAFSEKFDVFCFGTLALRSEYNLKTIKKVIDSGVADTVYCDLNIRKPFSTENAVKFCLENAHILKISDEEMPFVTKAVFNRDLSIQEAITELCRCFKQIQIIIITLGADGSLAYVKDSDTIHKAEAVPTKVLSTVGAGDSFGATFVTQYFKGKSIDDCLSAASRVSSFVVSKEGAVPDGIKEFIKTV